MDDAVARAAEVLGERARADAPLGPLTTYRVGGAAALLMEVADRDDLERAGLAVAASGVPVLAVGQGSNLLVSDRGFPGLVLIVRLAGIEVDATAVTAAAGVSLPVLARRSALEGLTGLEWAVGVPGSVGGAVRMNAGGHGSEVSGVLRSAVVFDLLTGERREAAAAALGLGYRRSDLLAHELVVSAEFALERGDRLRAEAAMAEIVRWRRAHQPGGSNAGSVFANPPGDSAGRLIDSAGLKGHRVGSASVSTKHANFFQADPGGSADDVRALMSEVQRRVEERTGVRLEPEVRLIGFEAGAGRAPR